MSKDVRPIMKVCYAIGCNALSVNTYCDKHKREKTQEQESKRLTSTQRGYDYEWRKFRKAYLADNIFCYFKEECHSEATEVHHIKPLVEYPNLKYERSNLLPLCKKCHSKITREEQLKKEKAN